MKYNTLKLLHEAVCTELYAQNLTRHGAKGRLNKIKAVEAFLLLGQADPVCAKLLLTIYKA